MKFEYSSQINAPLEKVWEFHERQDILELLTPPWQPVKVIRRQGGLNIDAETEFLLFPSVFNIRWLARHTEYQKYQYFTDQQVIGPMDFWQHRHSFQPKNSQTILTDSIEYKIPGGWLSEIFLGWWVNSRLQEMFRYRHEVTKKYCELS